MNELDVSIQLVNYNTKRYLEVCIDGVIRDIKESSIHWEVLVLDNASSDDLNDLERMYQGLPVRFLRSDKNLGFGGGHNLLAKEGKGEYLLLLNPDIEYIERDTIKRLLDTAKEKNVAVVGPRLITKNGSTQAWDHGELEGFRAWIENNKGDSYWKDNKNPGYVAWVSGAAFLIKKSIFDELGGFDEKFFLYKEEEDLCLRLRGKGYAIWYEPSISMIHIGSVVAKKSDYMDKSKAYYIDKHFKGSTTYWLAKVLGQIWHG